MPCGFEHAFTLRSQYEKPGDEAVLIDARNDFNCLNRNLAVQKIRRICPAVSFFVQNSFSVPSDLYVAGKTVQSLEGTPEGDPIAMAMYGVALLPLLRLFQSTHVSQKWYADGGSALGRLEDLLLFSKQLTEYGNYFGYTMNASNVSINSKSFKDQSFQVV